MTNVTNSYECLECGREISRPEGGLMLCQACDESEYHQDITHKNTKTDNYETEEPFEFKQKYITIPMAIAYWFIPTAEFTTDAMSGYIIFGVMLTIGALSDLDK